MLLVLLSFGLWYFFKFQAPTPVSQAPIVTATPAPLPSPEAKKDIVEKPPQTLNKIKAESKDSSFETLKSSTPLKEEMPSLNEVRAEVQKDPHETPPQLLKFSEALESKMQIALKSEAAGRLMMSQLQDCALAPPGTTSTSVSAMCLVGAKQIAAKYVSLNPEAEAMLAHADENTLRIYKGMHSLGIK